MTENKKAAITGLTILGVVGFFTIIIPLFCAIMIYGLVEDE